jgi:SAM-dependent methyltransferase
MLRLAKKVWRKLMVSYDSPVEYNKHLWDDYAKYWDKDNIPVEDETVTQYSAELLGDEWGRKTDVEEVIADFIYPYVDQSKVVAEIGSGGARVAAKVIENTAELYCFDISREMLKHARKVLGRYPHAHFELLKKPQFAPNYTEFFDFVYSFDVFVHLDLHTIWKYFQELQKVLKPGGQAFIHTTNLLAPDGWSRFAAQEKFSVVGQYFISPQIVEILAARSNLAIIKTSTTDSPNFYYHRDYLFVLEKGDGVSQGVGG